MDRRVIAVLIVKTALIAKHYVVIGESEIHLLFRTLVQPKCRVDIDIVSPDVRDYFFSDGFKNGGLRVVGSRANH